jgi:iron complex outermembrane receptor protein
MVTNGLLSIALPGLTFAQTVEAMAEQQPLQEVVVTAQKRPQAWSKVAAALSVISSEDLKSKGVTSASNLTEQVPNVVIGTGSQGGMDITIRGIGNSDNGERGDPQAAFHVDGIYIGRPQGAGATFFDLERVEVLRGPQGTLYGRNANAGAINVITKKPSDRVEAELNVDIGNYKGRKVDAMINLPVNEMLSLRAVTSKQQHAGYSDTANAVNGFTRDRDDQDNLSGRLQAKLKISRDVSWLVGVDSSRDQDTGSAYFEIINGVLPSSRKQNPTIEGFRDNKTRGATSELKVGFDAADVTYLYGHRVATRDELSSMGDGPGAINDYSNRITQDSHELRLSSPDVHAPLQWVAGLYRFKEVGTDIDLDVRLPVQLGGGRIIHFVMNPNISASTAQFGQATYALTPKLRATIGLRNTSDKKSRLGQTRIGAEDAPIPGVGNDAAGSWSKRTYRVGAEYDVSTATMVYASLATGYKAGGFNDGNSIAGDPSYNPALYYNPETIKSWEGGVKTRLFSNKLQLGATAFYYDYSNLQKSAVVNNVLNTVNAGKASVKGLELEGRIAVSSADRINFAIGLLNAQYDAYTTPNGQDLHGKELDRAPKSAVTLGWTRNWQLSNEGRLIGYLGSHYSAAYVISDTGDRQNAAQRFTQPSSVKTDMTVTYEAPDDTWNLQVYAKNLADKSNVVALFTLNNQKFALLSEPRTFGTRLNVKF